MFIRSISFEVTCYEHKHAHMCLCNIQGVPGGMDQTSGECSLC